VAPYFASEMDVKVTENYGQLRVTDSAGGKPLSKVYVKLYAELADGSVKIHKDRYADIRGRFDYASVSTPMATGRAVRRVGPRRRSRRRHPRGTTATAVRRSWWWRRPGIGDRRR
jgi:hypothetical protein